jgi:glycosyltransferase involved in cell wall biosynthesis
MEIDVLAITCFYGRKKKVERVINCFLQQDYPAKKLLLYNNSPYPVSLSFKDDRIFLVNNHIDLETGKPYTSTGAIFRDAVSLAPAANIITFMDSDDLFLPNHLSEGVKGMIEATHQKKLAYKPLYSIHHYGDEIKMSANNNEPSIFVRSTYVKQEGFHPLPCSYHQKWLDKLIHNNKILVKPNGLPTFIYDWSSEHGDFKISGLADDPTNFRKHRQYEKDFGDYILTPSKVDLTKYDTSNRELHNS